MILVKVGTQDKDGNPIIIDDWIDDFIIERYWDFPERTVQVYMSDEQYVDLVDNPNNRVLLEFYDLNRNYVVKRDGGRYLYLEKIRADHKYILESYGAIIDLKIKG